MASSILTKKNPKLPLLKKHLLLAVVFGLMVNVSLGEIKNGYEKGIQDAHESLKSLYGLRMNNELSPYLKRKTKSRIQTLRNFITYYELTGSLLNQFKMISPVLYAQIDNIKDINGRPTDVYVKFIPEEEAKIMAAGITSIGQAEHDRHMSVSEYGERTVSVKVWIFSQALSALSHEFGHVNYLVPNLASYSDFYRANYPECDTEQNYIGHNENDLSGKNAFVFEKKFRIDYVSFFRNKNERIESPVGLLMSIRKRIEQEMTLFYHLAAL